MCALLDDGGAACWGVVGTGGAAFITALLPIRVTGAHPGPIAGVSAGAGYTCTASTAGDASCFGGSLTGLGAGAIVSTESPVPVLDARTRDPLGDVVSMDAGLESTCAVLTNGEARCWGTTTGDGTDLTRDMAVPVVAP